MNDSYLKSYFIDGRIDLKNALLHINILLARQVAKQYQRKMVVQH